MNLGYFMLNINIREEDSKNLISYIILTILQMGILLIIRIIEITYYLYDDQEKQMNIYMMLLLADPKHRQTFMHEHPHEYEIISIVVLMWL